MRAGKNDSQTDNSSSGGVFFRIDKNDYLIKTPRNIDGFIDDTYRFNKKLKLQGQFIFNFVFNAKHIERNFQKGIQTSVALEYKVF